jgi:hypothetical protein
MNQHDIKILTSTSTYARPCELTSNQQTEIVEKFMVQSSERCIVMNDILPKMFKTEGPMKIGKTWQLPTQPNGIWLYQTRNANMDQTNLNNITSLSTYARPRELTSKQQTEIVEDSNLSYSNKGGRAKQRMIQRNLAKKRERQADIVTYVCENAPWMKYKLPQAYKAWTTNDRYLFTYVLTRGTRYPYRGDDFFMKSALYANSGNIHTDRKLTHLGDRTTQGIMIPLTYMSEAVTAVAGAFSTYLLYKTGKNVYHTSKSVREVSVDVLEKLKKHSIEIVTVLYIFGRWYKNEISTNDALLMLAGLGIGWIAVQSSLLSGLFSSVSQLFPAHSTNRETQGFEPTTLLQSAISLIAVLTLGTAGTVDAKGILNSIRGLSATILTVKTVEQCLVNIVTFLPDIIQRIIAEYIPSFGLYCRLNTDPTFKNFVTTTHRLQTLPDVDLFYNSHNLNDFVNLYSFASKYFLTDQNYNTDTFKVLKDEINWLDNKHTLADALGLLPGRRKLPFVVWISGDPGIGKSTLVRKICRQLLTTLFPNNNENLEICSEDQLEKLIFSHNTSNKYFDGYQNQPIFVLNDYLQFANQEEEQWLIRFVDTLDCPLEVSSVDNIATGVKGEVRFTSRIIVVTSNQTYLSTSKNVTSLEAFNRRRDVVLDMKWKPNARIPEGEETTFDYSWCQIFRKTPTEFGMGELYPPFNGVDDAIYALERELNRFLERSERINMQVRELGPTPLSVSIDRKRVRADRYTILESKMFNSFSAFFNSEFMGIKFKYLIPLIVGGTSSAYLLYKTWVPSLVSKFTQSLSGDSGTQKLKKATRPLKRMTMGYQKNNVEVANRLLQNTVRISTFMVGPDGQMLKQTMWGWSLGGSLVLTPKHLWRRGSLTAKKGDRFVIERGEINHECYITEANLYLFEDEDLAVVNVLGFLPSFKKMDHLLLADTHQVNSGGEEALLIVPTQNQTKDNLLWPTLISVDAFITDAPYKDEFGEIYQGRGLWQYNHKLVKGDCGSLLVIQTNQGMKIAGLHVAGDAYSGNSEVFTQSMYDNVVRIFEMRKTQGFCTDVQLTEDEFFDAVSDLEGNWYYLGKAKQPPYQNAKSEIRPSPLYETLQPHNTEPAVLTPSDKRMIVPVSPIIQSVAKYGTQIVPFDQGLLNDAFNIVSDFYQPIRQYKLRAFNHEDAINALYTPNLEKIDIATSAGYPWNTKGLKKSDLITNDSGHLKIGEELNKKIKENEDLLSKNIMFPYTLVTTLKDERVSLSKVAIGKTRTFMNFPVEYTILMRRYFDDFIDKETKHAIEIGTTVGVNIYSTRWNELFNDLNRFEFCTDGDFKAFDGTIRPEFFRLYTKLVNSIYADEHSQKRDMLVNGCCFAPMFVLDKVYVKLQGNPSGSRLTTSFNSFVNRMYVVMSMLHALPRKCHTQQFFRVNMKMYAHGDDHIIGFSDQIREYWSALYLRDFMLSHGIDYTSSTKDAELGPTRDLMDCYYLKSYFIYDMESGTYRAGLDKSVIQEMVSWQRDNDIKSTEMIVNTALRYAYFWGITYFQEIYGKLEEEIKRKHLNIHLIDYLSLDMQYTFDGEIEFTYNK